MTHGKRYEESVFLMSSLAASNFGCIQGQVFNHSGAHFKGFLEDVREGCTYKLVWILGKSLKMDLTFLAQNAGFNRNFLFASSQLVERSSQVSVRSRLLVEVSSCRKDG